MRITRWAMLVCKYCKADLSYRIVHTNIGLPILTMFSAITSCRFCNDCCNDVIIVEMWSIPSWTSRLSASTTLSLSRQRVQDMTCSYRRFASAAPRLNWLGARFALLAQIIKISFSMTTILFDCFSNRVLVPLIVVLWHVVHAIQWWHLN